VVGDRETEVPAHHPVWHVTLWLCCPTFIWFVYLILCWCLHECCLYDTYHISWPI